MKRLIAILLVLCLLPLLAVSGSAEGVRRLTLYWTSPDEDYEKCDVWIWFPGKDGSGHLFEPCDYGVCVSVDVPESVDEVGFIVRRNCSDPGGSSWGSATKDFEDDRFAVLTGDLDSYGREAERIFTAEGIPFFLDQKKLLIQDKYLSFFHRIFLYIN